ncbi:MAG: hypothetical protein LBM02_02450 [Lachnospiraceae bacterium]|nr:hypothetical protein [Lachnospiraceae bacterium]
MKRSFKEGVKSILSIVLSLLMVVSILPANTVGMKNVKAAQTNPVMKVTLSDNLAKEAITGVKVYKAVQDSSPIGYTKGDLIGTFSGSNGAFTLNTFEFESNSYTYGSTNDAYTLLADNKCYIEYKIDKTYKYKVASDYSTSEYNVDETAGTIGFVQTVEASKTEVDNYTENITTCPTIESLGISDKKLELSVSEGPTPSFMNYSVDVTLVNGKFFDDDSTEKTGLTFTSNDMFTIPEYYKTGTEAPSVKLNVKKNSKSYYVNTDGVSLTGSSNPIAAEVENADTEAPTISGVTFNTAVQDVINIAIDDGKTYNIFKDKIALNISANDDGTGIKSIEYAIDSSDVAPSDESKWTALGDPSDLNGANTINSVYTISKFNVALKGNLFIKVKDELDNASTFKLTKPVILDGIAPTAPDVYIGTSENGPWTSLSDWKEANQGNWSGDTTFVQIQYKDNQLPESGVSDVQYITDVPGAEWCSCVLIPQIIKEQPIDLTRKSFIYRVIPPAADKQGNVDASLSFRVISGAKVEGDTTDELPLHQDTKAPSEETTVTLGTTSLIADSTLDLSEKESWVNKKGDSQFGEGTLSISFDKHNRYEMGKNYVDDEGNTYDGTYNENAPYHGSTEYINYILYRRDNSLESWEEESPLSGQIDADSDCIVDSSAYDKCLGDVTTSALQPIQDKINNDGQYKLVIWTSDEVNRHDNDNHQREHAYYINVDKNEPVLDSMMANNEEVQQTKVNKINSYDNMGDIPFDKFFNSNVNLKLNASEAMSGSGIKNTEYAFIDPTALTEENGDSRQGKTFEDYVNSDQIEWEDYSSYAESGIDKSKNDTSRFVIFFKVTDYAGNVAIFNSDGITIENKRPTDDSSKIDITHASQGVDLSKPVITIDLKTAKPKNGIYNRSVAASIDVADPVQFNTIGTGMDGVYSGLKQVDYSVYTQSTDGHTGKLIASGSKMATQGFDKDGTPLMTGQTHNLLSILSDTKERVSKNDIEIKKALNNSNFITIKVSAIDFAGNVTTSQKKLSIDTTAPKIEVSYDNNSADSGKYFKNTRTATVKVTERNFKASDLKTYIKNVDGWTPKITKFTRIAGKTGGNGDDTVWIAKIKYVKDGKFTYSTKCTDEAGNTSKGVNFGNSVAPTNFVVDLTNPTINVSYDNNSAQNGKYFKAHRTATVIVDEHNFSADRVKIVATAKKNGSGIAVPSAGAGWSTKGDVHTMTIPYNIDGDYTFDVTCNDLSGRNSGAANYGNSVAGKDFTIDTTITKPIITINGSNGNGKSYKDKLIPAVKFDDINLADYQIKLTRTVKDKKNQDVTKTFIKSLSVSGQSGRGSFDTFTKVQGNDGIYTLSLKINDKAGNSQSETTKFSCNRFGSVYVYGDYLTDLIKDGGDYTKNVDDDLVVTEYNPDKIVKGSLDINVTKDGQPEAGLTYDSTPEANNKVAVGESGWYQYKYVINKDNFDKDGTYKMNISSKDMAGNTPQTSNYKEDTVLFHVDKTAPEISSIEGLEDSIINKSKDDVHYKVFDAMRLKNVEIYVDGKKISHDLPDILKDDNNYDGDFILDQSSKAQKVRMVVTDKAGNITDTGKPDYKSAFSFKKSVVISTNFFVRWFANKPLFFGSLAVLIVLICLLGFFFYSRSANLFADDKKKRRHRR